VYASLYASIDAGMLAGMAKITVHVPDELLEEAQAFTGAGVTETVREGLKHLRAKRAQRDARKLRGKIVFDIDLMKLRQDED
jgi:Arc/MetJ-type ribon-helix-helix transcriptional regulator